jgi:hypothetical protein
MICPTELSNEFSRVLLIPKGQTFIRGSQIQLKKISIPYNLIEDHKVNPYIQLSPNNLERETFEYKKEESFFCTSMSYYVGDVAGTGTTPTSPQENEFINDRILKTTKNLGANLKIKKRVTKVARTVIDAVSFLFAKGPYYETLSSPDFNNPAQDSKINQQKPDSWSKLIIDTNEYDIDSYERNNI